MRRFIAAVAQKRAFASSTSKIPDSIANGTSGAYIEDMHAAWKRDPTSVHASWQAYFKALANPSSMNDLLSGLHTITQSPFIAGTSSKSEISCLVLF